MERLVFKKPAVGLLLAGVALAGCSSISHNDLVEACNGNGTPVLATYNPSQIGYDKATDPAILFGLQKAQAEATQAADSHKWNSDIRNQVIGIGQIVCQDTLANGQIQLVLTNEGDELSAAYRANRSAFDQ